MAEADGATDAKGEDNNVTPAEADRKVSFQQARASPAEAAQDTRAVATAAAARPALKAEKDKGPLSVHPSAIVTAEAKVSGPGGVTIGEGSVVHPACTIYAKVGPIQIGSNNIFEEQVMIVNASVEPLVIGNYNTFEVGSKMLDTGTVGDLNVFECKSKLGKGVVVADGCTVGACVSLQDGEVLGNETICILGEEDRALRRVLPGAREDHKETIAKHLDVLREMLKMVHTLKK
mmetsp:Transcript_57122/g.128402  ORF Transcript_57122/g.128402 Transcript_57122/m.128402 type:complete len:233 (+) Transcript_57122:2-700(+)